MTSSPFLESIRNDIRLRGYSIRTEKTYIYWIKNYILFNQKQHPEVMGAEHVKKYLTWLAVQRHVAINTQKVALNALVYLYRNIIKCDLGDLGFKLATKQRQLPIVLSAEEISVLFSKITGKYRIVFELLYGSGLRVNECLRLRVQDIGFSDYSLMVRDGKRY